MPCTRARIWQIAAVVALTVTAGMSAFTLVWDSDLFWHLAGGQWMLRHKQVLSSDPWSIDPMPVYVNVHWLFQVIIAALHWVGGFAALSAFKAVMAGAILFAFAWSLRRMISPTWLIMCGLAMLLVIHGRVRVRPESVTLLFLTITMLLIDSVRRGGRATRLWWLVPIMLLWVNMHGLFILGVGLIWGSMAGSMLDRWLGRGQLGAALLNQKVLAVAIASTAVCFITPWPLEAASQPFLLWTRLAGAGDYYRYIVSELGPLLEVSADDLPTIHVSLTVDATILACLAVTVLAMAVNFRRVPLAHVLWLLPLLCLAFLAKRNVALLGPVFAILLALHGQDVLAMAGRAWSGLASKWARAGAISAKLRKVRYLPASIGLLACMLLWAGLATSYLYGQSSGPFRFGAGLASEHYPVELARFLGELDADGDIFTSDFGNASAFIYYSTLKTDRPNRLVYMDGRLEVHTLERFISQHELSGQLGQTLPPDQVLLPPTVRFVVVGHDSTTTLTAMMHNPQFRLIRIDANSACFADETLSKRGNWRRPLPAGILNLADFDQPLDAAGLLRDVAGRSKTWCNQNEMSLHYQLGEQLFALGQWNEYDKLGHADPTRYRCSVMAVRQLTAADAEGVQDSTLVRGMLAQAYQSRAYQAYFAPSADLPVQPSIARSIWLYDQLDLRNMARQSVLQFAIDRLRVLLLASQIEAASSATETLIANLPSKQRVNPPHDLAALRSRIQKGLTLSKARMADAARHADLMQRVDALTSPDVGLIDTAIGQLRSSPLNDEGRLRLGDLLLQKGRIVDARSAYADVRLPVDQQWKLRMRLALCDAIEGRLHQAAGQLQSLGDQPAARFYLAYILEEIGDYAGARKAIAATGDEQLNGEVGKLRRRLPAD